MGVFDKFLDIMKLNEDDYDDQYDEYDEGGFYDDDEYEEKPRHSFFGKKNNSSKEDSYKDFDVEEEKEFQPAKSKVTQMRTPARHSSSGNMDLDVAQRIIDFISGATFAINGNLQKISNYIFLVTPTNVDISGDLQDLLGGSMETASVRGRYSDPLWRRIIVMVIVRRKFIS